MTMPVEAWRLWRERLTGRWPGSPLRRFLKAWGRELVASLPVALQSLLRPQGGPHYLDWPLANGHVAGTRGVLLAPSGSVLLHRLALPVAAGRDLQQVMQFELDRFTPFTAGQVYYALRRERIQNDVLWVTLAIVRREVLDQCLAQCAERGIVLDAVDARGSDGVPLGVDLLPGDSRSATGRRGSRLNSVLGLCCAVLVMAIPTLWVHNREIALAAMHEEVQTLRRQAGEFTALRNAREQSSGALRFLIERRLNQTSRAQLLSELTRCLPTDTWLQTLEIRSQGQVDMGGLSAHASALIGDLKGCPHLTDVRFQGVIQPDPSSGRERFYLRAKVRGEERDAAPIDRS